MVICRRNQCTGKGTVELLNFHTKLKWGKKLLLLLFFKFKFIHSSALILARNGLFMGFLGESLYRYTYDIETGTSHYRTFGGKINSWQSPERRGNGIEN